MTSVMRHPPLPRDLPGSVPGGGGSEGCPPLTTGLGGGSAAFRSLNTAKPPPCLPSVTNALPRQVPYSSLLKGLVKAVFVCNGTLKIDPIIKV